MRVRVPPRAPKYRREVRACHDAADWGSLSRSRRSGSNLAMVCGVSQFLYSIDGSTAHPTELTMGPWGASAQHGGPPSALLAFVVEQHLEADEVVNRIHVDLLAGVPLGPLRMESSRQAKSRRVAHVEACLLDGERVVAQARGLLVRTSAAPPPDVAPLSDDLPGHDSVAPATPPSWWSPEGSTPFHSHAVTHRFVSGAFDAPGPAIDWIHLDVDVVEGHHTSGVQRVAAISDLGSGISAVYGPQARFGMINTDLTIGFVDSPTGEWFCLDAQTTVGANGSGLAQTRVVDEGGKLVAVASQSLLGRHLT